MTYVGQVTVIPEGVRNDIRMCLRQALEYLETAETDGGWAICSTIDIEAIRELAEAVVCGCDKHLPKDDGGACQISSTRLPIVVLHGAPGIGKTTTAAKFPNPVFIQTEDGCPGGLTIASFGLCETFSSVIEALTWLGKEPHDYQTLVIDSLDALEPLVQAALCADRGYTSVESPGFGKGYVELDKYWLDLLRGCNWLRHNRNLIIVMIAHSEITMINDPRTAAYSSYALRLHKRARGLVEDSADVIGFLATDIIIKNEQGGFGKTRARADGSGARWLHCEPRPAFTAKNRFGMLERILVPVNFDYQSTLGKFLPTPQPQAGTTRTAAPETVIETMPSETMPSNNVEA